ncbi:MAG: hypothetical protein AB9917_02100 [Negativicutes bacterium]
MDINYLKQGLTQTALEQFAVDAANLAINISIEVDQKTRPEADRLLRVEKTIANFRAKWSVI